MNLWTLSGFEYLYPDKVLVAILNYTLETRMLWILFSYSHVHFITSNPLFPVMAFSAFWLYCDFCMDEGFFAKADQLFTYSIYWCPMSSLIPDLYCKWQSCLRFVCVPINRMKAESETQGCEDFETCCMENCWLLLPQFLISAKFPT